MPENKPPSLRPFWGKIISLLFAVALLAMLEGATRLLTTESQLDSILALLTRDPVLVWRNRPNLDTRFAGAEVVTNRMGFRIASKKSIESQGGLRIVCFGASPTFGWGVPYEATYAARLEALLTTSLAPAPCVINGGMIGYSSHQGKLLIRNSLRRLRPDLITVSYVINDIDKYRFFSSNGKPDRSLDPRNNLVVRVENLLGGSRFVSLFQRTAHFALRRRNSIEGRPVEVYRPQERRVPPDDYRSNLETIVDEARSRNVTVVLIKMPVNLPTGKPVPKGKQEQAMRLRYQGIALFQGNDFDNAANRLEQAAALDPHDGQAHYFLGLCRLRLGQKDLAQKAMDDTMVSETYRCGRDGLVYNAIVQQVADQRGVPMVDAVGAFAAHDDRYLFVSPQDDPIHPNALGHDILARELYRTLVSQELVPNRKTTQPLTQTKTDGGPPDG